ncbi:hypothetical protein I656_00381 [Geobacillus sp. WSUCF1]|nr:hypothetical protein I656_00381 [Geobacillus sp. WSUCF1]
MFIHINQRAKASFPFVYVASYAELCGSVWAPHLWHLAVFCYNERK